MPYSVFVPHLTISEVARQFGLQPSAIRYCEQIGLLPPAERMSGRRIYDRAVLCRLAVVQRARQSGFSLEEIRHLFFGFRAATGASERWEELSRRKLAELEDLMDGIKTMRSLMKKMMQNCRCETLEQCGEGILRGGRVKDVGRSLPLSRRRRL